MGNVDLAQINWLAVIVAAAVTFLLGGLWYGALFAKPWIAAQGYTPEQFEQIKRDTKPAKFYGVMVICYLIMATVIAIMNQLFSTTSLKWGALVGLLLWIVVALVELTGHVASNKKFAGYLIDVSYQLIYLVFMGALIGSWW